jgi:voltage-gated potassium channel
VKQRVKQRLFRILEIAESGDTPSRVFDIFIMTLISLNVVAVILATVKVLEVRYSAVFRSFEVFSVAVFTIEYTLRLWTSTSSQKYKHPVIGRFRFATTPLALVDLIAILPFYLPMFIPFDLRFVRALRLVRLFRLFKMGRYSKSLRILGEVLRAKKEELVITVFVVFILLVVASSLMYYVETEAQPESFSSIPSAMWWGVCTLTTVGYGDVSPITPLGKFLGSVIALLGIGVFALPAGILASGLVETIEDRRQRFKTCPHCGKKLAG